MKRRLLGAGGVAVILIGLGGCKSTPTKVALDPARAYERAVTARIAERHALAGASEAQAPQVSLRYNPVPCGCPPWELLLSDRWQRAVLDDNSDAQAAEALMVESQRLDASSRIWRLDAEVETALTTCGAGTIVVSIKLNNLPEDPTP